MRTSNLQFLQIRSFIPEIFGLCNFFNISGTTSFSWLGSSQKLQKELPKIVQMTQKVEFMFSNVTVKVKLGKNQKLHKP